MWPIFGPSRGHPKENPLRTNFGEHPFHALDGRIGPKIAHLGDACLLTGGHSSSDRKQYGSMSHAVAAQQKEIIYGDDDR